MDASKIRPKAAGLLPEVISDLERLASIPSVSFPGYPEQPVLDMADAAVEVMRAAGYRDAHTMEVPDGYPPVYAEVPGPAGSLTVMLYAHYDVQPAPLQQGWSTDPWTPTRKDDGRIYARGIADDKSGVAMHAGTMKAFDGRPRAP